jgi:5-oxoprolinase (ATP-hydrolysing) subunit C
VLEVIEPGLLTTVQDAGRRAALDLGVPVSGACDPWSLAVANAAVGNPPGAAAIEMTLLGAQFRARDDCVVAAAGADMGWGVDGRSASLRRGDVLRFGPAEPGSGIRTYLAIAGGVDVPSVLGSRSTCLVGGFGGLEGRPLRVGDVISAGPVSRAAERLQLPARTAHEPARVRLVAGAHRAAVSSLVDASWHVSPRADRQGMRLDGPRIAPPASGAILSQPVSWGTVQLPPDGTPIVLLADAQTVGGYSVLGVVITADLPVIGQLGPGDQLRFELVSLGQAQTVLRDYRLALERIANQS